MIKATSYKPVRDKPFHKPGTACYTSKPNEVYLQEVKNLVSQSLAKTLINYALLRFAEAGFSFIKDWQVSVEATQFEYSSNYHYTVKFTNELHGYVSLIGIELTKGWPTLDHGFAVGEE